MYKSLEAALLDLKKGNNDALEFIYEKTRRGIFTFVLPIVSDYAKAEDIMEQTYVHLYEHIDKYEQNGKALNWILTIARNLALAEVNRSKKEMTTDFSDPLNVNLVYVNAPKVDSGSLISLANEILTPEEFQIVMMHVVGEYKHREISETLNIPLGTVTWKYNEAIKKLKKVLIKREKLA